MKIVPIQKGTNGLLIIFLSGCGGRQLIGDTNQFQIGFSSGYRPPLADYDPPAVQDPNFKIIEPAYVEPYWVDALLMEDGLQTIESMLSLKEGVVLFNFPLEKPAYIPVSILGWAPANEEMKSASKQIFVSLEKIINVRFEETNDANSTNVIAVSQSNQSNTAGFSYFPNNFFELGSDVFISKSFSSPLFLPNERTNYDYEVLIHEIGHSLGLKHPFETDGYNTVLLETNEDKTIHTAMSYDDYSFSFDGTFRALDWMALTKLYGVDSLYAPGNDTYKFNASNGLFIIDGGGTDTIDCSSTGSDVYIDLRPGMHSYHGTKSVFITSANQLTISHGSDIENVETGFGNDLVIGNDFDNLIKTSDGHDIIFAGNGSDIVVSGVGKDVIDLSEDTPSEDTLIFEFSSMVENSKVVYGFEQGNGGDVLKFENMGISDLNLLPLVDASHVPIGHIDNCLVRVFGDTLSSGDSLQDHFSEEGLLKNLKLSESESAFLISSNSQDTGEAQNLYTLTKQTGAFETTYIGTFFGNYLDIDNWTVDNFAF